MRVLERSKRLFGDRPGEILRANSAQPSFQGRKTGEGVSAPIDVVWGLRRKICGNLCVESEAV